MDNSSTATSTRHDRVGLKNPEDKEPLPKRLKDVKKERVLLIEKNSALCENTGTAYVDLSIEKGKYKLYYLRIENEQRIMSNSRLEVLGSSSSFTISKVTNDTSQRREQQKEDNMYSYEESYSYANSQDSSENYRKKRGSNYNDDSSSLDSAFLMRQI